MLRVIRRLNDVHALDLFPTFLGAHEFPPEYRDDHEGYIAKLIDEMIPYVAREGLAEACDIFCETGVYSIEESTRILLAAKEHGLKVKVHADQLSPLGGAKLAADLGALSADHIEFIDDEGIEKLASSGTVAGLLPVAAHFLRMKEDPPVREMIDRGVICALATDFNPGSSMCESMPMALHLAVMRFRVNAEEAFWMATAGSARALGLTDRGWIGEGALADLVVWSTDGIEQVPYHFGVNHASQVYKRGRLAAKEGRPLS
jgi:imidazolonepropionase